MEDIEGNAPSADAARDEVVVDVALAPAAAVEEATDVVDVSADAPRVLELVALADGAADELEEDFAGAASMNTLLPMLAWFSHWK